MAWGQMQLPTDLSENTGGIKHGVTLNNKTQGIGTKVFNLPGEIKSTAKLEIYIQPSVHSFLCV